MMKKNIKKNVEDLFALTPVQEGMLFHYLKEPDSDIYFEQLCLQISGKIDIDVFEKAWNFVIASNEMLRTVFRWEKIKSPTQVVLKKYHLKIRFHDLSTDENNAKDRLLKLAEIKRHDKQERFDLREFPFRVTLCRLGPSKYEMILSNHHILYDGWSNGIILKEFFSAYENFARGKEPVKPGKSKFKEFVTWIRSREKAGQEEFWKDYLRDFDAVVGLPVKRQSALDTGTGMAEAAGRSMGIGNLKSELPKRTGDKAAKFVKKNKITMASLLYSVYGMLLLKYCNGDDTVFGITTSGRSANIKGIEDMVGLFVNTLPLRVNAGPGEEIIRCLHRVNEAARRIEAYETTPLVEVKKYRQQESNEELFDSIVVIENYPLDNVIAAAGGKGFAVDSFSVFEMNNYDLTLAVMLSETVHIDFIYNRDVLDDGVIGRLSRHFAIILEEIVSDPQKEIRAINILTEEEKRQLLFDFNDTAAAFPGDKLIHEFFEEQAVSAPDTIALFIQPEGHRVTYRQLHTEAARLAEVLAGKGARPGIIVPLLTEPSAAMIAGILGILMAGAAYLPMDPSFPADRISYMVSDSAAGILLTCATVGTGIQKIKDLPVEKLFVDEADPLHIASGRQEPFCKKVPGPPKTFDEAPERRRGWRQPCVPPSLRPEFKVGARRAVPGDIAYIIYTSGTTGRPKGVLIEHRSVVRLLFNDRNLFDFSGNDVWTMFHSYCFDFSVWEMYGALLYGGKLAVTGRMAARDPGVYWRLIRDEHVTVLNQTPSAFYNLIEEALKHPAGKMALRVVIFGGEALKPIRLKEWAANYPGVKLINMFGITETTVHVTYKEIGREEIEGNIANIGKPIPTLRTYIMDRHLALMPPGTAGELCVGGDGVARGYLNQPELTAHKFIASGGPPFCKKVGPKTFPKGPAGLIKSFDQTFSKVWPPAGTTNHRRLYRSGDLARFFANGDLEYLGRIDHQVQIRGHRIELAGIENRLLAHDRIKDAVVISRDDKDGDDYLCTYIVPISAEPGLLGAAELRPFLSRTLPDYMIPAYFMELEQIPLTSNGKVDRRKLPAPEGISPSGSDFAAPVSGTEKQMAAVWQRVLGLERVGITDNFFNIGGDSIKAIRLISAVNDEFSSDIKIKDLYAAQTTAELAAVVEQGGRTYSEEQLAVVEKKIREIKESVLAAVDPAHRENIEDIYPMSDIEKGMIFYYLKNTDVMVYHDQFVYPMKFRDFDAGLFEKTMFMLIETHQILRTGFDVENFDEPVQIVYKQVPFRMPHFDISHLDRPRQKEYVRNYLAGDKQRPIDAGRAPLFRMAVFSLDEENVFTLLITHHAVIDGWSAASLITELHNTYLELKSNPGLILPEPGCTYRDAVVEEMIEKSIPANRDFWYNELKGYKRLEFPRVLHTEKTFSGMRVHEYEIDPALLTGLEQTAGTFNISLNNLCMAAFVYVLAMLCDERDIVVGSVGNNRPQKQDGDKILGCFLNTLPLRIKIPSAVTWSDFIRLIRDKAAEIKNYERVPLFEIARVVGEKSREKNPIFDSLFNFMNFHIYYDVESEYIRRQGSVEPPFTVTGSQDTNTLFDFEVSITFGKFLLCPKYNYFEISDEMVHRSCVYYERVLRAFTRNPHTVARKGDVIPEDERRKLLYEFNDTAAPYDRNKLMHRFFEEQVEKTPCAAALAGPAAYPAAQARHSREDFPGGDFLYGFLTYRELNKRANRLARVLRQRGLQTGDLAAVVMDRSLEMVSAVLAVLKAGGAYVPLEPYLPDTRIRKLLESLDVTYCVTNHLQLEKIGRTAGGLAPGKTLTLPDQVENASSANLEPTATAAGMAYIIFTSGSSGTPKGVVVRHQPVINLIEWVNTAFAVGPADKIIFVSSLGFDLSVYDIFGILAAGGCIRVVPHGDLKEPQKLLDIILTEGITFWDSAPAALQQAAPFISDLEDCPRETCFRLVFLSGDWIPVTLPGVLRDAFAGLRVISLGGATEATVWSNYYPIAEVKPEWVSIPYGKPIQNAAYYILDAQLDTCPFMVPGDLYIGGECLASGYINDVELSASKFIDNPFVPGGKMYRTGDIARWFLDGNMEFLGRKDQQVKIRGYRIELGEIESQLQHHEEIKEAIVLALGENVADRYLCAYIVSDREFAPGDLKDYLSGELPEYMIPKYFMEIEKIPMTVNGKVDRKALPAPGLAVSTGSIRVPVDGVGKKLARLWAGVLDIAVEQIGIESDFFELGGHSLNATVLASKIHKSFDVKIPLAELFRAPTIGELSAIVKGAAKVCFSSVEPVEKKEYYRLSSAQKRLYVMQRFDRESTFYNMPGIYEAQGNLDEQKLRETFRGLTARHESLRTSFIVIDGEPVQRIHDASGGPLFEKSGAKTFPDNKSFSGGPGGRLFKKAPLVAEGMHEKLIDEFIRPFDLTQAPLLRVGVFKKEEERYILTVDMPHIISDGMSTVVLIREFSALYAGEELNALKVRYKDFSVWQNGNKENGTIKAQEDYWLKTLSGDIPKLHLPGDYPGAGDPGFVGSTLYARIAPEEAEKLKELAREEDVTLFMLLLAFFNILLAKISSREDILVGTPVSGRRHADLQDTIGMFVNTLTLRNFPAGGKKFKEFLHELKDGTLRAFENQDYQFEDLVEQVAGEILPGQNPIFDVMFSLQNINIPSIEVPGLKLTEHPFENKTAKFDMMWTFREEGNGILFYVEYKTKLFTEETIGRIVTAFEHIIQSVLVNPDIILSEVEAMTEEEKERILFDFNDTATSYPKTKTLQALFQEQAERNPHRIALAGPAGGRAGDRDTGFAVKDRVSLTYGQLNRAADELAGLLIRKGAGAGSITGLMVERSIEMIAGVLAVLKAGGAYLPIDPAYPEPRKRYMLMDSSAKLLLTARNFENEVERVAIDKIETIFIETGIRDQGSGIREKQETDRRGLIHQARRAEETQHLASLASGGPLFEKSGAKTFDEDRERRRGWRQPCVPPSLRSGTAHLQPAPATCLAYIMYTSGSTGSSKGVMVEHRSVTRLVINTNYVELNDETRILLTGAPVFDATTFEIWGALLNGGILFLVGNDVILNAGRLGSALSRNKINTLWLTSPLFNQLMQQDDTIFCQLRHLLVGGDVLSPRYIEKVRSKNKNLNVINGYGPTENTTFSTTYLIDRNFTGRVAPAAHDVTKRHSSQKKSSLKNKISAHSNTGSIPIGNPVANSTAYILDRNGNLQLPGVPGELVVGGDGLARGYLNNPELTNKKFLRSFFQKATPRRAAGGKKLYYTGDLCRWNYAGHIEFLGRMDQQVKIRGFRVDPGEIESRLLKREDIREAVVTINEGSEQKYLCAYIVGDIMETSSLRRYLAERVPGYMVPSYFTILDEMPLTPNGKIDRRRLPEPEKTTAERYVAPRDEVERKLVTIWSSLFGVKKEKIGIDDNFFELGGHSLKATKLVYFIHKEFEIDMELKQVFATPCIRELAHIIKTAETKEYTAIAAVEEKEYYEISYAQRRLWILCQLEEESTAYNMPGAIVFSGIFDTAAFTGAVQALADRHESLRTVFIFAAGQPYQRVIKGFKFNVEQIDLREFEEKIKEEKAREIYLEDAGRAFDLRHGPLFRFKTVRLEEEKTLLILNFHHIISDGWSRGNIHNEIITLYNAFRAGRDNPCPPLQIRYKDYSLWHNNLVAAGHFDALREYWVEKFKDKPNGVELPIDHPRQPLQTFNGGRISFTVDEEKTARLSRLSVEEDVTFFMTLLALATIFLHKYSGQEDILTGSPIANRRKPELHSIVGFFVNTLVFRNRVSPGLTFAQYLDEVKRETLECYEHQDYPFDLLVEQLGLDRDLSRSPLFNFMLAHNNAETEDSDMVLDGLISLPFAYAEDFNMSKFDLVINMNEVADCISLSIEYNSDLFDRGTIERMAANFPVLIDSVLAAPGTPISRLNIICESESEDILHRFNDTAAAYPKDRTIPELFHEQAERNPHRVALSGPAAGRAGDRDAGSTMKVWVSLTYSRLSREIDDLAGLLIRKGVGADTVVGLSMERSIEMVIGIFAVLKAGGAYLPMEPQNPAARKRYMLKDSSAVLLLSTRDIEQEVEKLAVNKIETVFIEAGSRDQGLGISVGARRAVPSGHTSGGPLFEKGVPKTFDDGQEPEFNVSARASCLAYVIYTSGSTGRPKGVVVEHRSAVNILAALQRYYPLEERDTYLLKTSYQFDVSITEFFGWFFAGGRLAVLEQGGEKDPGAIIAAVEKNTVTHINFVPSMFNVFVAALNHDNVRKVSSLKYIFLAGEPLLPGPVNAFRRFDTAIKLENIYGPTEGTVYSSYFSLSGWQGGGSVPIGKPVQNAGLYILDKQGHLQPIGVPGELCIAGENLARGYLNRPELTADKFNKSFLGVQGAIFQKSPLAAGGILYKTGDLARWRADSNIEFLGRLDNQVKIRGFRIELGEIESRLLGIPGVEEASVLAKEYKSGDRYLCAYIVAKSEETLDAAVVREHLSRSLPGYMVPSHFVFLDGMPLTANGKIDRDALPEPEVQAGGVYEAPRDDVERRMTAIWSDVLGIAQEKIGIDDNFFELGGQSLILMQMVLRIQEEFGSEMPLNRVFSVPTIRGLAGSMHDAGKEPVPVINPVEKKEYYHLSAAQKRFYIVQYIEKENTSYHIQGVFSLQGEVDEKRIEKAFHRLIERHESLRTAFRMEGGEVVQVIKDKVTFRVEYYDAAPGKGGPGELAKEGLHVTRLIDEFIRPFDMSLPPLFRAGLIKIAEERSLLEVDMNHIIVEESSLDILVGEFFYLYNTGAKGELPPLRLTYKDFSEWQNREIRTALLKRQENWWLEQFPPAMVDDLPRLNLPLDYERHSIQGSAGSRITVTIDREETAAIKKLVLEEDVTLFIVILTLCNLFFAKICHQEDIIVGSPIINRRHTSLLPIVGNFLNTLTLRNYPRRGMTFREFLKDVGERTFRAFRNRDYPYEELVDRLLTRRDSGRNSLFDVLVALRNAGTGMGTGDSLINVTPYAHDFKRSPFDIAILASESGGKIDFSFFYRTTLFKRETIDRMIDNFKEILAAVLADKDIRLGDITISGDVMMAASNPEEEGLGDFGL